jgi:drug/metabolite transporter (DMT)-like permease
MPTATGAARATAVPTAAPARHGPSQAEVWAGLVFIYIVWGSTYLAIRIAVETIPPFLQAAMRFIPAGLLLFAFVAIRQRHLVRRPTRTELRDMAIVGTLLAVVGNGFVSFAEQTIPSGVAALIIALTPAWFAIISRVAFGDVIPRLAVVGIVIGLAGIAILAWPVGGVGALEPIGLLALLVAPIGWSSGSAYAARVAKHPQPAAFSLGLQMLFGGIVLSVIAIANGEVASFDPAAVDAASWAALLYLMLMGSLASWTVYAWLLRNAPLPLIGTYAYVNPIVAVILGAIVLSEPITPRTLIAAVVIIVGVALVVTARGRMVKPSSAAAEPSPDSATLPPSRPMLTARRVASAED